MPVGIFSRNEHIFSRSRSCFSFSHTKPHSLCAYLPPQKTQVKKQTMKKLLDYVRKDTEKIKEAIKTGAEIVRERRRSSIGLHADSQGHAKHL